MEPCPNEGCLWQSKGRMGLMFHKSRCPFKRLYGDEGNERPVNQAKRRRLHMPNTLKGAGPRRIEDNIHVNMEPGCTVMPHDQTQDLLQEEVMREEALLLELRRKYDVSLKEEQSSEEEEGVSRDLTAEDAATAFALFLNSLSGRLGISNLNRMLSIMLHPAFSKEYTASQYDSAASLKAYSMSRIRKEESKLESLGFKERMIETEGGTNCSVYFRNPVEVLRHQLERSCKKEMIYEHIPETNRAGERIYNHPMSGKIAEEGIPEVESAIRNCRRKDVVWDSYRKPFVGALQVYSDKSSTTMSSNSLTFYPLHMNFLNFKSGLRHSLIQKGVTKVAFLPVYMIDAKGNPIVDRATKIRLLHRVLSEVLKGLFDACWTGIEFTDKDRITRCCYPFLGNYITDIPESKDLTSTKYGLKTQFPCARCLIRGEDFALCTTCNVESRSVKDTLMVRKEVNWLIVQARESTSGNVARKIREQASRLLDSRSLTAEVSSQVAWPFMTLHPVLDLYRCITFEPMHNLPLGVGKLLKTCLAERLNSKFHFSKELLNYKGDPRPFSSFRTEILTYINKALKQVEIDSPSSRFHVDFSSSKSHAKLNGLYTKDGLVGMLEAANYAHLDQVFPFMAAMVDRCCGEVEEAPNTKVSTLYCDLVRLIYRKGMDPGHTKDDLKELRAKIKEFKEYARKIYGPFQSSGMGTIKYHMLDHIPSDIERLGSISSMDAGLYESAHKEVKKHYRWTSRRKASAWDETVKSLSESQARERLLEKGTTGSSTDSLSKISRLLIGNRERSVASGASSTKMEAVMSGSGSLAQKGVRIFHGEIRQYLKKALKTRQSENCETELVAEEFSLHLRELVADVGITGLDKLSSFLRLKALSGTNDPHLKNEILSTLSIERVKSGSTSGMDIPTAKNMVQGGDGDVKIILNDFGRRRSQRFVCAHSFYGSKTPRLDCVMLEAAENAALKTTRVVEDNLKEVYIAKALVLFRIMTDVGPLSTKKDAEREFVFLKYFDAIPLTDHVDETLGCVKLRWSQPTPKDLEINSDESFKVEWHDVQSVSTIRGRVQVIRGDYFLGKTKTHKKKGDWKDQWFYVNRFKYDSNAHEIPYYEQDRPVGNRQGAGYPRVATTNEEM